MNDAVSENLKIRRNLHWTWKRYQSAALARVVEMKRPAPLVRFAMKKFMDHYGLDLTDSVKPFKSFTSINDLFTREIDAKARPIDRTPGVIVSPVDGTVHNFGRLKGDVLIQAKDIPYPLGQLIPSAYADRFRDGAFMTIYLSPKDGHRIFSPVDARVAGYCYVPGLLYMVREPYASTVTGLYALNERLTTYLETDMGAMALVKVAALNVAKITAAYDPAVVTNTSDDRVKEVIYDRPREIRKGEHLATFNLGSTVVLVLEKKAVRDFRVQVGQPLKYGATLAA